MSVQWIIYLLFISATIFEFFLVIYFFFYSFSSNHFFFFFSHLVDLSPWISSSILYGLIFPVPTVSTFLYVIPGRFVHEISRDMTLKEPALHVVDIHISGSVVTANLNWINVEFTFSCSLFIPQFMLRI